MAIRALVALAGAAPAAACPRAIGRRRRSSRHGRWPAGSVRSASSSRAVIATTSCAASRLPGVRGSPSRGELLRTVRARRRQRGGKVARFELSHAYPAAATYTVTVHVLSGGCGKRPAAALGATQRDRRRRLTRLQPPRSPIT